MGSLTGSMIGKCAGRVFLWTNDVVAVTSLSSSARSTNAAMSRNRRRECEDRTILEVLCCCLLCTPFLLAIDSSCFCLKEALSLWSWLELNWVECGRSCSMFLSRKVRKETMPCIVYSGLSFSYSIDFLRFTWERNNALHSKLILGSIGRSGPIDPIVIACELTHMKLWPNSNTDSCIRSKKILYVTHPSDTYSIKFASNRASVQNCRTSAGSCSNAM